MRIAHITAGAGHMYCGSCLRDNVLAAGLLDAGHDACRTVRDWLGLFDRNSSLALQLSS